MPILLQAALAEQNLASSRMQAAFTALQEEKQAAVGSVVPVSVRLSPCRLEC